MLERLLVWGLGLVSIGLLLFGFWLAAQVDKRDEDVDDDFEEWLKKVRRNGV